MNQETLFSLEELAHSEVFNVKSDWSDDITSLRQLAIKKPQVISEQFIFQHFTTLRLVDRNVSVWDWREAWWFYPRFTRLENT